VADLSVTAASCVPGSNSRQVVGFAGEAIAAGKAVYLSSTTNLWMLADSNSATAEARTPGGIALTGSATGQPVVVHTKGLLTLGATMTANTPYFLSDTAGGICPIADVGSGEYLAQLGLSTSTTVIDVNIHTTGVAN
jgi:hypothetical protein